MKRGRKKGSKKVLINSVVQEYKAKYPQFEGLLEFYVPLKEQGHSDYDLIVIDRAKSSLTGIKIYKVNDHIPSPEYFEPLPSKISTEMKIFRGSKCILTVTKKQEDSSSLTSSDKIKEALAELIQKITKFLEEIETKNEEQQE